MFSQVADIDVWQSAGSLFQNHPVQMCEVIFATNDFNSFSQPIGLLVCNVQLCLSSQPNVVI
jgi:hypothetical protein